MACRMLARMRSASASGQSCRIWRMMKRAPPSHFGIGSVLGSKKSPEAKATRGSSARLSAEAFHAFSAHSMTWRHEVKMRTRWETPLPAACAAAKADWNPSWEQTCVMQRMP